VGEHVTRDINSICPTHSVRKRPSSAVVLEPAARIQKPARSGAAPSSRPWIGSMALETRENSLSGSGSAQKRHYLFDTSISSSKRQRTALLKSFFHINVDGRRENAFSLSRTTEIT